MACLQRVEVVKHTRCSLEAVQLSLKAAIVALKVRSYLCVAYKSVQQAASPGFPILAVLSAEALAKRLHSVGPQRTSSRRYPSHALQVSQHLVLCSS